MKKSLPIISMRPEGYFHGHELSLKLSNIEQTTKWRFA